MAPNSTSLNRRTFLKSSLLAGGGMMLSFSWLASCRPRGPEGLEMPETWTTLNGYLKIGDNGVVTIMAPNPEFGQNVKTSLPMIVADELDVDWQRVVVEQAPFDTALYTRQFAGGSQSVRQGWQALRTAGASARQMLRQAAADLWQVPLEEVTTEPGVVHHRASGQQAGYGALATRAAALPVPEAVELKAVRDFTIIRTSRKNVDAKQIVMGKPLFGVDIQREGMLVAMVVHPPAFGMKLKSFDADSVRDMPGIRAVFPIQVLEAGYARSIFDTTTFPDLVAVVGDTTWQVMNARKALVVEWEPIAEGFETRSFFGNEQRVRIPAGLESSADHRAAMAARAAEPATVMRRDGDPEAAFRQAAKVIERTYYAPFLAHNCMEPMNFFAHVTADTIEVEGPLQAPEFTRATLAARFGVPVEQVEIRMSRMGGGFGRRAYSHYLIEAALISQQAGAPVKLLYTREDDMTYGIYRPAYTTTYRAALDAENNLIGYHVKGGGIPEAAVFPGRFPAGAVPNYLAESWTLDSNITIGAFRAPRSNFAGASEQAFLDEVAEAAGQDPIAFRLQLLARSQSQPVGERNDYDPERYAGVLKLVQEKAGWDQPKPGVHRGVAAYFCHNSYAAHVIELTLENGAPLIHRVVSAIDCGIVINPDAATNMVEGAVVDGIGQALFGEMTFSKGVPDKTNFDTYRMIRHSEAPKAIEVHFVQHDADPTGLGEPPFPPVFAALANALYQATGERLYDQPFG